MTNSFYTVSGSPARASSLASAVIRSEFALIQSAFNLMPALSGSTAGCAVIVNSLGTALTTTTGTLALAGNFSTTGAFNTVLAQQANVTLMLPAVTGTLATLAGTETLTNKSISGSANTLTNVPVTSVTGTLAVANGGTGAATASAARTGLGIVIDPPQGRLTLTTATPYLSADTTAATTIYYTPAIGGHIPIYDGSNFIVTAFSEISQALSNTTKQPAAIGATKTADAFVWSDGGTIRLCLIIWSTATARGTGAGTCELQTINGINTNKNAITNGPGANLGTYVGTISTDGATQCNMVFGGGTGAAGGQSNRIDVWNAYNQVLMVSNNFDNTNTWAYTTATLRAKNGNNNNKIFFVCGLAGVSGMHATNAAIASNTDAAGANIVAGIGLNSTSAIAVGSATGRESAYNSGNGAQFASPLSELSQMAPIGANYVCPLEYSQAVSATTFYGDNGTDGITQSMFTLKIWC